MDGYRRYLRAALPLAELVVELANEAPAPLSTLRTVAGRRARGVTTLLRWSRRSVADVLRTFFTEDAMMAPAIVVGPGVWGLSPYTPGTGLGALTLAMKHVASVGRPVGGSGAVPVAVAGAFEAAGGRIRTCSRVTGILCEGERVRGVELDDGTRLEAPIVVSACDPHATFLSWLRNPPASAQPLVDRWKATPRHDGYESKVDAVISELPVYRQLDPALPDRLGFDPLHATAIIAPPVDAMHAAHRLMAEGRVADEPMFFANVPSVLDPTMQVGGQPHRREARPARLQPRGALHALRADRRLGRQQRARALAGGLRTAGPARLRGRHPPLPHDDAGELRARVLHAQGLRHQLRRRAGGRAAGPGP